MSKRNIVICKGSLPKDSDDKYLTKDDKFLIKELKSFLKSDLSGAEVFQVEGNVAYTEKGAFIALYEDELDVVE